MRNPKYYVIVFKTKADRAAGEHSYEYDADTLDQANEWANGEIEDGMYAASIYERSGSTDPSIRIATHIQPLNAAEAAK